MLHCSAACEPVLLLAARAAEAVGREVGAYSTDYSTQYVSRLRSDTAGQTGLGFTQLVCTRLRAVRAWREPGAR